MLLYVIRKSGVAWCGITDWRRVWGSPMVELPVLDSRLCHVSHHQFGWRSDVWQDHCFYLLC